MTRILVIYGTTDGYTRKVAHRLAMMLRVYDVDVDVVRAGGADVVMEDYSGIIVCASVHGGHYQRRVARWVRAHAAALADTRTAFVSVCLGVLQNDPKVDRDLDAIAQRFFNTTGWQPTRVKKIAGALLYRQYGWLKRWIMKRIVAKAGGDVDTSKNYEYTDWADLQAFVDEFVRLVAPVQRAARVAGR
jgi:menaquinone-dependent protoporphyrinogen oxidase